MHLTTMPSALLSHILLTQAVRQKQVVAGHRGRSMIMHLSLLLLVVTLSACSKTTVPAPYLESHLTDTLTIRWLDTLPSKLELGKFYRITFYIENHGLKDDYVVKVTSNSVLTVNGSATRLTYWPAKDTIYIIPGASAVLSIPFRVSTNDKGWLHIDYGHAYGSRTSVEDYHSKDIHFTASLAFTTANNEVEYEIVGYSPLTSNNALQPTSLRSAAER